MVEHLSSISNSSRSPGPPWAFATAVGLLLALELLLRVLNPHGVVAIPEDRELAYRALGTELEAYGAPEVAIVGSSRARRAVLAPLLREMLHERGHDVRVGNFALGGAQAEELAVAMRRIAESEPRPKLVVWPISARELEGRGERPVPQVRYLWRPSDWWRARQRFGSDADPLLPDAIRNEAARYSLIARYRFAIRDIAERPRRRLREALGDLFRGRRGPTPMHGDADRKFLGRDANVSLPVRRADVEKYVGDAYQAPDWPRNYQAEYLQEAIDTARRAEIRLIFVELPTHPLLEAVMPEHTNEKFRSLLGTVAKKNGVRFVPLSELSVVFEKRDYREESHVNARGSEKYTRAIEPVVVSGLGTARGE